MEVSEMRYGARLETKVKNEIGKVKPVTTRRCYIYLMKPNQLQLKLLS